MGFEKQLVEIKMTQSTCPKLASKGYRLRLRRR